YRPFFHLAIDWGINQSNVCRIVNKIEKILISSGLFNQLDQEIGNREQGTKEHEDIDQANSDRP
ncbi:MAG: transposase family protein, partial [Dolichospermum sp.]